MGHKIKLAFLIVSILIHFVILSWLHFKNEISIQPENPNLEIEIVNREQVLQEFAKSPSPLKRIQKPKKLSLGQLTPTYRPGGNSGEIPPVTGSLPDGDEELRAQAWAFKKSQGELLSIAQFLKVISEQIKGNIEYKEELLEKEIDGTVELDVKVDDRGKILSLRARDVGPKALRGLAASTIKTALAEPLGYRTSLNPVLFTLRIKFRISHYRERNAPDEPTLNGNTMTFTYEALRLARYDITAANWEENILRTLFGKPKPDRSQLWDLNKKTSNLLHACNVELVPEVCLQASENLVILDRNKEAFKIFEKLCDEGVQRGCELKEKNLRSR